MTSREYRVLDEQLAAAGAPTHVEHALGPSALEIEGAVAALVNSKHSAAPYEELLLAALPELHGTEAELVVRALTERGLRHAGPVFVEMLETAAGSAKPDSGLAWALGNALATLVDPRTFAGVMALCSDTRLGSARQMLLGLLPRIGTDSAYRCAVSAVEDESVRGHAIEALGRFKRSEALGLLRSLATRPGKYEHKAKATAIRRLERHNARRSN